MNKGKTEGEAVNNCFGASYADWRNWVDKPGCFRWVCEGHLAKKTYREWMATHRRRSGRLVQLLTTDFCSRRERYLDREHP